MGSDNKPAEEAPGFLKGILGTCAVCSVMQTIGVAIAYATFKLGATTAYSEKLIAAIASDQTWMCAGFAIVAYTMRFVNFYPMGFKEKVTHILNRVLLAYTHGTSAHSSTCIIR